MIEEFLVSLFKAFSLNLTHTVPSPAAVKQKSIVVYDRLGGAFDVLPGHDSAEFAFDVYGSSIEKVLTVVNDIRTIFNYLETIDGRFPRAEIHNLIDNSQESEIVYTVYVRLLYRAGELF